MKKLIIISACLFMLLNKQSKGQEQFGNTLNIGAGIGYYGYIGNPAPVGNINYEFDVARNFTLAPTIGIHSYQNYRYWGNPNFPYRYYYYRETIVPVGVKASYYFDELFNAGSRWDFYAAGSIGFAFRNIVWETGYYGDRYIRETRGPLYIDLHIGSEYHLGTRAGLFLDLSTGVSTFGVAIHF